MHIFDLNRFLLVHVYKWNICIAVVVVVDDDDDDDVC